MTRFRKLQLLTSCEPVQFNTVPSIKVHKQVRTSAKRSAISSVSPDACRRISRRIKTCYTAECWGWMEECRSVRKKLLCSLVLKQSSLCLLCPLGSLNQQQKKKVLWNNLRSLISGKIYFAWLQRVLAQTPSASAFNLYIENARLFKG